MYRWYLILSVTLLKVIFGAFSGLWGNTEGSTSMLGRSGLPPPSITAQSLLLHQTLKTPINFREQSDADLIAENLSLFLHQAITTDDQLSTRYSDKVASPHRREWEAFCGAWRMRNPVGVECRVDENKSLQTHGYIDCFVSMAVGSRIERERFARYYVATRPDQKDQLDADGPKDKLSVFSKNKQERIREFKEQLVAYSKSAKEQNSCIRKLFSSTSYSRRLFSPFHPSSCCPRIKFRTAKGEERVSFAFLLPLAKENDGSVTDIVAHFARSSPNLFYRILTDPQLPLPEGCLSELPVVHPMVVTVEPYVIDEYVEGVKVFISQLLRPVLLPEWVEETPSEGSSSITRKLGLEIIDLLNGVSNGLYGYEFLDASQPLPYMTNSPNQPMIPECLGLGLFSRVLHGPRPGLWLAIRGQNQLESSTNAIGNFLSSYVGKDVSSALARITPNLKTPDQTTAEFRAFNPVLLNGTMMVKKYHISRGKKSLFVVIIWDNDLERHEGGSRPVSPIASKRFSNEDSGPRKIGVVSQQPGSMYPVLPPLEQRSIAREFYEDYHRKIHTNSPSSKHTSHSSSPIKSPPRIDTNDQFGDVPPIQIPRPRFQGLGDLDDDYKPSVDAIPDGSDVDVEEDDDGGFSKL